MGGKRELKNLADHVHDGETVRFIAQGTYEANQGIVATLLHASATRRCTARENSKPEGGPATQGTARSLTLPPRPEFRGIAGGLPVITDPHHRETMNVFDAYQYGTQHFGTTAVRQLTGRSKSPRMRTRFGTFGGVKAPWARPPQDRGRSPHDSLHGLYRALLLAHGEHVT